MIIKNNKNNNSNQKHLWNKLYIVSFWLLGPDTAWLANIVSLLLFLHLCPAKYLDVEGMGRRKRTQLHMLKESSLQTWMMLVLPLVNVNCPLVFYWPEIFLFLSPLCKDLWLLCEVNSKANVFYCVPEAGKYLSLEGKDKARGEKTPWGYKPEVLQSAHWKTNRRIFPGEQSHCGFAPQC